MALAERMLAARFNRPGHEIVDHRTWAIASDGYMMEGVASEAASLAGHLGLSRLCVFYDDNHITIDGTTSIAFTEDVGARFAAYGWNVLRLTDQATLDDLAKAADAARAETARPTLVVTRTHIGFGSPNRQDTPKAHGEPLGKDEARATKERLGWPPDASFLVPDDVRAHLLEAGAASARKAVDWRRRFEAYGRAFPAEAAALEDAWAGTLPADFDVALRAVGADGKATSHAQGVRRGHPGARRAACRPSSAAAPTSRAATSRRSRAAAPCSGTRSPGATSRSACASTGWAGS